MKGFIKFSLCTYFCCIFFMIKSMSFDPPKPIELRYSQFKFKESVFLNTLEEKSCLGNQIITISQLLSNKEFCQKNQKDIIIATCCIIFKQQSTLASYLINGTENIHDTMKFSIINNEHNSKESHFKWTPLCFAIIKWNQAIIEMLRNKGASLEDIPSSKGFLTWLTDTINVHEVNQRLSILAELGFPGQISETDSLLKHDLTSKKNCTLQ